MKKHISYPKIQQFRNVVTDINREVSFIGLDKDQNPIFDDSIKRPIIIFKGTVKLHGTNASVCFNSTDGYWIQSRQNIITIENDNAGFAVFADKNRDSFLKLINQIIETHNIDTSIYTVSIYGEWAGKKIQKGVGIAQIDNAFFIIGVKISKPQDIEFSSYWLDSSALRDIISRIFNVEDYKTFSIEIDFNEPQLAQDKLSAITEQIEKECPISKAFGIANGVGEGVVWSANFNGNIHRFKVKGEKHSVTRVRKLASIDTEKLKSINDFVEYSVTENRFNQAVENIFGKEELDIRKMGDFIKWMVNDITTEELDTILENNLEPKDVNKYISIKAKEMFFKAYEKF